MRTKMRAMRLLATGFPICHALGPCLVVESFVAARRARPARYRTERKVPTAPSVGAGRPLRREGRPAVRASGGKSNARDGGWGRSQMKEPVEPRDGSPEPPNRSNEAGGSRTALLALYGRSQAYRMQLPGATDSLAPELMKRLSLFGTSAPAPEQDGVVFRLKKALTSIGSDLSLFNYRLTRRLKGLVSRAEDDAADRPVHGGFIFEDQVAYIATLGNTGLVTPMHARTRWLDEKVDWFAKMHGKGGAASESDAKVPAANVVVLGSGYDTRAYRMESLRGDSICVYEVDAPGTQAEKRRLLRDLRRQNVLRSVEWPAFVACDFSSQNWLERLLDEGFDDALPTLVVWEGVTMYLPLSTVKSTLEIVADAGRTSHSVVETSRDPSSRPPPWYIAFDYLDPGWAYSPVWKFAMRSAREPFRSAFTASDMSDLLGSVGLHKLESLADGAEIQRKYATEDNGVPVGAVGNYGGFILAGPAARASERT